MPALQKVMILCATTNRPVPTGLMLFEGEKLSGFGHRNFLCGACGQKHDMKLAFFEGSPAPASDDG